MRKKSLNKRFKIGQPVELSLKGRRFLKRRDPRGWVVAQDILAIKVVWVDSRAESEWWNPSYFMSREGEWLNSEE